MTKRKKRPGDEPDKPLHTGEMRNGRLSALKNAKDGESGAPDAYYSALAPERILSPNNPDQLPNYPSND
ncbi:hypothetical protein [Gorillibacterium massiliense]|uniref:hypothetical protein n=1 Tax=Gorillibacterium massiliense TaxID=1280390 RepID=UPI0004BAD378|nr:hypothetical protein [Gorillibacterium massiliense]